MRIHRLLTAAVVLLIAIDWGPPVHGRPVRIWTYDEMAEAADLVVIAVAKSVQDDGVIVTDPRPNAWVGVLTSFDALVVLKGKLQRRTFTVSHDRYRAKEAELTEIDGPGFVQFDTTGQTEYLLFLKRSRENVYAPVSGPMDPWVSVRIVRPYVKPPAPDEKSREGASAPPSPSRK